MVPDLAKLDGWIGLAVLFVATSAILALIGQAGNITALARRAASTWNRGKAVHDRVELSSAEKHAWRQIRRRFAREARQAALAADNSERRPT